MRVTNPHNRQAREADALTAAPRVAPEYPEKTSEDELQKRTNVATTSEN